MAYEVDARLPTDITQDLCKKLEEHVKEITSIVNETSPHFVNSEQIAPAASIRAIARLAPTTEAEMKRVEGMSAEVRPSLRQARPAATKAFSCDAP